MTKRSDAHRKADARYNKKRKGVKLETWLDESTAANLEKLADAYGSKKAAVTEAINRLFEMDRK